MNKQVEQEAKRLMGLFKKPIMKWNGIEWVEKVEENKQDAIKCIDEMIIVAECEGDTIENLYKVKNYIETNY